MKKNVLVIAGEISGDMHAARVIESLRERTSEVEYWGIGGDELRAAGVEIQYDVRDMAVLGLWEVIKRYAFFRRVFHDMLARLDERKPDAVLLVDYPGFNLRFAREAHRRGVKVLYYICPQVWAWHRSRIHRMAKLVDRLMVIFPFEVDVFSGTGLRVDFVGHPLVNTARRALQESPTPLPWDGDEAHRVAMLPGSRRQEMERILPPMIETACRMEQERPGASFLVAAPSERMAEMARDIMGRTPQRPAHLTVVTGNTRQVLRQARAAMVASGTATLETALMGCPLIVVYRTAALTYWFGKRLIRVPYLGMVNIVAGRALCPEFLQHEADPEAMAKAVLALLDDSPARAAMLEGLREVTRALGEEDSAEKTASIVLDELGLH